MILSIAFAAVLALDPQQTTEVQNVMQSYDTLLEIYGDCAHGKEGVNDACDRMLDSNDVVPDTLESLKAQLETKGWFAALPADTRRAIMGKHRKLSLYTLMIQTRRDAALARTSDSEQATCQEGMAGG